MSSFESKNSKDAFTLVELMVVLAVMAAMTFLSIPALRYLTAGDMGSVQGQMQGILEQAREYARAHRTYVRVGMAQVASTGGTTNLAVQCLYSTSGDLRNDNPGGLASLALWPSLMKTAVFRGIQLNSGLKDKLPPSSATVTALGTGFTPFTRALPGDGNESYQYILQFDPQGEASLDSTGPVRTAMIGLSNPHEPSNPVVILLSGLSGGIEALRAENLQQ